MEANGIDAAQKMNVSKTPERNFLITIRNSARTTLNSTQEC